MSIESATLFHNALSTVLRSDDARLRVLRAALDTQDRQLIESAESYVGRNIQPEEIALVHITSKLRSIANEQSPQWVYSMDIVPTPRDANHDNTWRIVNDRHHYMLGAPPREHRACDLRRGRAVLEYRYASPCVRRDGS